MTKAIRIHENGGPEVMRFEDIELPPPGEGEVRLRHTAIGVNYSDLNVRRGGFYLSKIELPTGAPPTTGLFAAIACLISVSPATRR